MHTLELYLSPEVAASEDGIKTSAARELRIPVEKISALRFKKRSIDARRSPIKIRIVLEVYTETAPDAEVPTTYSQPHSSAPSVIIIGCGPAGMFAALRLLDAGIRPILLERGKAVRERRRDLAAINKERIVDEDSNYCFGEGGAGTYSDGKLYTRSGKRGSIDRILKIFTEHGADERIRYEAHPHIGTNKLPGIVSAMSDTIRQFGGEIHFEERVCDFVLQENEIKEVITQKGNSYQGEAVILATGHSARDIFELLEQKQIAIEVKPYALGVRIEHPQSLIDSIQYHCVERGPYLPPSSYSLVEQVGGRGVFSFCMCPGGIIAPAATAPGEVVVNGWSPSKRNNPYANSGMVVALSEKDFIPFQKYGNLAGLEYQRQVEQRAFLLGGSDLTAPGQRLIDFLNKKTSTSIPETSYIPGVKSTPLDEVLPQDIAKALRGGLQAMGKKMRGYLSEESVLVGVESRTSSPVRIPRDRESLLHPQIVNLYPCGEGAGYAGGIVSAAIDGERCAEAFLQKTSK
ncbi:MAG: FAD-dependent oxidoreductase [Bacteroidota bacterium]|nr:FAD-dependent oxidoreductase [Bacteroidota bacterium]MDX5431030.1 FAD-dependent oxidoreductase [Bacteroidota bacterium]MDX5469780.1 FAD-dependent oxidoreductase [Bacteroidota bacterium]